MVNAGEINQAINLSKELINNCILVLSDLYLQKGDEEVAISVLKAGLDYSLDHNIYNNLGALLLKTGQCDQAADYLKKATVLFPNADAFFNYGIALQNLGRLEEAFASLEEALKLNPELTTVYCVMANACAELTLFQMR